MITSTYTVSFPNVVRPKYEEEALKGLRALFDNYEVKEGSYDTGFNGVNTMCSFKVEGVESLEESKQIFLQMKDYFLNVGNFQLTEQDIKELINYSEGL